MRLLTGCRVDTFEPNSVSAAEACGYEPHRIRVAGSTCEKKAARSVNSPAAAKEGICGADLQSQV